MNCILKNKKKIKVLLDTNIVIDILTNRPTSYNSKIILNFAIKKIIIGCLSSKQITDIYYILRKYETDKEKRRIHIKHLINYYKIYSFKRKDIINGFAINGRDFEDDLLITLSNRVKIKFLITNNTKDFDNTKNIKIYSPNEFITLINNY